MGELRVRCGVVVVIALLGGGAPAWADSGCPPSTKGLDVNTLYLARVAAEHATYYREWKSSGAKPSEPSMSRGELQSLAERTVHQLESELFPYGFAHQVMLEVIDLDYLTTLKANPPVCTRSDADTCAERYDAVAAAWHGLQPLIDLARNRLRTACLERDQKGSKPAPTGAAPEPWKPGQPLKPQPTGGAKPGRTGTGTPAPPTTSGPAHPSTYQTAAQIEADRRRNEEIARIRSDAQKRTNAAVDAFAQDLTKRATQDKTVAPVFMGASSAVLLGAMVIAAATGSESAQAGLGAMSGIYSGVAGFALSGALVEGRGLPTTGNAFVAGSTAVSFNLSLALGLGYGHISAGDDLGLNEFSGEALVHLMWLRLSMRSGYRFGGGHKAAPTMFGAALQPMHGGLISPYFGIQGGLYPQSGVELMNGTSERPDSSRGIQWVLGNTWSFDRIFRRVAGPFGHRSLYVDTAWLFGGGEVYGSGFQVSVGTRFTFGANRHDGR
jgi:hypothetical protein